MIIKPRKIKWCQICGEKYFEDTKHRISSVKMLALKNICPNCDEKLKAIAKTIYERGKEVADET